MATPTQITSTGDVRIKFSGAEMPYNAHPVIFESSGGNYYFVGYDFTNGKIGVAKSTTLTGSYSVQDATNAGGGLTGSYAIHANNLAITAAQDGNTLHIAYCIVDNSGMSPVYGVHYEQFNMSTDSYVTTSPGRQDLGTGYDWSAGSSSYLGIAMGIRADGDLIVVHRADDGTSMGSNYARLAYARLESGTWTTGTSLPFDQAAVHYYMATSYTAATGGLVFDGGTGRVNIILNRDASGGNTNYYHYKLDGSNTLTRIDYTGATSYYHGGAGTSMVTTEGDEASYNDGTDDFYFAPGGWGENHAVARPIITNVQDNPTDFETDYDLFNASTSSYNPDYCYCVIDTSGGTAYLIYDDNNSSASFYTAEYDGYNSFANVDTDTGDDFQALGYIYYIDCANPTSPGQYRYLCWTSTGHTLYVGTVTAFSAGPTPFTFAVSHTGTAAFSRTLDLNLSFATSHTATALMARALTLARSFATTAQSAAGFAFAKFFEYTFAVTHQATAAFDRALTLARSFATSHTATAAFDRTLDMNQSFATSHTATAGFTHIAKWFRSFATSATHTAVFTHVAKWFRSFATTAQSAATFARSLDLKHTFATTAQSAASFTQALTLNLAFAVSHTATAAFSRVLDLARSFATTAQSAAVLGYTFIPGIQSFTFPVSHTATAGFTHVAKWYRTFATTAQSAASFALALTLERTFAVTHTATALMTQALTLALSFATSATHTAAMVYQALWKRAFAVTHTATATFARALTLARSFATSATHTALMTRALDLARSFATTVQSAAVMAYNYIPFAPNAFTFDVTHTATAGFSRALDLARSFATSVTHTALMTRALTLALAFATTAQHAASFAFQKLKLLAFAVTHQATVGFTYAVSKAVAFAVTAVHTANMTLTKLLHLAFAVTHSVIATMTKLGAGSVEFAVTVVHTANMNFGIAIEFAVTAVHTAASFVADALGKLLLYLTRNAARHRKKDGTITQTQRTIERGKRPDE